MSFKLTALVAPVLKDLKKREKQIAYGTSVALNKAAFAARSAGIAHLKQKLTLRNGFLPSSMVVVKASKASLQATVGLLKRAEFAERLEEGGTRRPRSARNLAIPQQAQPNKNRAVPKRLRPSALKGRKDIFYKEINGIKGIWQLFPGKRIRLLYNLEPSAHYEPNKIELIQTMSKAAITSLARNLDKEVAKAFASAK